MKTALRSSIEARRADDGFFGRRAGPNNQFHFGAPSDLFIRIGILWMQTPNEFVWAGSGHGNTMGRHRRNFPAGRFRDFLWRCEGARQRRRRYRWCRWGGRPSVCGCEDGGCERSNGARWRGVGIFDFSGWPGGFRAGRWIWGRPPDEDTGGRRPPKRSVRSRCPHARRGGRPEGRFSAGDHFGATERVSVDAAQRGTVRGDASRRGTSTCAGGSRGAPKKAGGF